VLGVVGRKTKNEFDAQWGQKRVTLAQPDDGWRGGKNDPLRG